LRQLLGQQPAQPGIASWLRTNRFRRKAPLHPREGKWANFYSEPSLQVQLAFLGRHLRDDDAAPLPRVRLEVQESRNQIVTVRDEPSWPLESPRWTPLHLTNAGLSPDPAAEEG